MIANAGPEDQAIATAGETISIQNYKPSSYFYILVSYLFRSLGSVVGLSIGSTLVQDTLRTLLHRRLSGIDADEVRQCAISPLHAES
jgi:hypothetical protein